MADAEPIVRWAIGMRPPVKALSVQAEIRILMVSLPQRPGSDYDHASILGALGGGSVTALGE
jgi:hypothetical protein